MSIYAFRQCAKGDPAFFNRVQMAAHLKGTELGALCELLGVATSGTNPEKIERLVTVRALREILAPYETPEKEHLKTEASVQELADRFKGKELRDLCKRAGTYAGSTKYAMAAALLQWRNSCRKKGQQALKRASDKPHRPRQMAMSLEDAA